MCMNAQGGGASCYDCRCTGSCLLDVAHSLTAYRSLMEGRVVDQADWLDNVPSHRSERLHMYHWSWGA